MANEYKPAPEVAEIARQLIAKVSQHQPLVDVDIVYLFIKDAPKSKGREVLGRARKVSGLQAWLGHPEISPAKAFAEPTDFFVIEISHNTWMRLDDSQHVALVDHELSHCAVDYDDQTGEPILKTRSHDVEEFIGVINRNGLWKEDVQQLGIVSSEQLSLALDRIPAQASTDGADQ